MSSAPGLEIGVDVPWITSWSEEPQLGVSPCPSVDGKLAIAQRNEPGAGEPVYARHHLFRQRKAVREMRCPMCGEPTADDDRWCYTAQRTNAGALRERGFGWALPADMPEAQPLLDCGALPPLHRACAEAVLAGPAHLGAPNGGELKRFPKAWIVVPIWVEARPPNPSLKSVGVVSFLHLVGVESGPEDR